MSALAQPFYTLEQYLKVDEEAETKSEYQSGQIFAMSGVTARHSLIGANLIGTLGNRLDREPCQVFTGDLRVAVMQTGLMTYPDASVVCGEPYFHPRDENCLINPGVLVEVLSSATEGYDRGEKWANYRQIDSLQEYVLVSQTKPLVEVYARQDDGAWKFVAVSDIKSEVFLPSLGCELLLADIYRKVVFDAPPAPPEETLP